MRARLRSMFVVSMVAGSLGCDVYDSSLLEASSGQGGGASTTSTTSGPSTSSGEGGNPSACSTPADCPGADGECGSRTCVDGACGVDAAPAGTATSQQTPQDCQRSVCDGTGNITTEGDDTDIVDDGNPCTLDTCSGGSSVHSPAPIGEPCTGGGGQFCDGAGTCVECLDGTDCSSGVCTNAFSCAPASCDDGQKNGSETAVDCGGGLCSGCALGSACSQGSDCASGACDGTCQPSCTDGLTNQGESDVDCGGPCADCQVGQGCDLAADCVSGLCAAATCGEYPLVISEFRARGPGGGNDDFVEIFNPLSVPVTLSADFEVASRSEAASSYTKRWAASGTETIPAKGHLLVVGSAYSGGVAADATLTSGITDKASVILRRGTNVIDALCLYCGATNPFNATYTCEGSPFVLSGCTSNNGDRSVERKPGGAMGNGSDTNDNASDFALVSPSNPQNLSSAPTP